MGNFIVSARKYRPASFDMVVGQSALTNTLKSSISKGRLAHSYLFCGPRGVGKTTCARIFAKTINCTNLTSNFEACNECESCKAFNEQRSLNIHELDAASNNTVDDIRGLIDSVRIPPQIGKYSIYIIDEVHMLSQSAFNAFLKTLEEPPAHAIFILATTEKHKILPTILSRCQIYDFHRISIDDVTKQLAYIAEKENIKAELEALSIIAQKADGAMRDALSIFDQLVACTQGNITYKNVVENLNILDYDYYFKFVDHFLKGEISEVLLAFNEILNKGFDAHNFIGGISSHFRNLLVSKDEVTLSLLETGNETRETYKNQAQLCDKDFLIKALQVTNLCDLKYNESKNKRLLIELTLIRLCQLTDEKKNELDDFLGEWEEILSLQPFFQPKTTNTQVQSTTSNNQSVTTNSSNNTQSSTQTNVLQTNNNTFNKRPLRSFSIKDSINKKEEEIKLEEARLKALAKNENFSQDELIRCWNQYIKGLTEQQILKNTMMTCKPILEDNFKISIHVDNSVQKELLEIESINLTNHLRENLNNGKIEMEIFVNEMGENIKTKTTYELFAELKESSPEFNRFSELLQLEIE